MVLMALTGADFTTTALFILVLCLLQVVMQNVEVAQHLGGSLVEVVQNPQQHIRHDDKEAQSSSSSSATPLHDGAAVHQQQRVHQSAAGLKQRNAGSAQEQLQGLQLPQDSESRLDSEKDA